MKDEPDGFILNLFSSTMEERKKQVIPFERTPDC